MDRSSALDSVVRLARAEALVDTELRDELRLVRQRLEEAIGPTVRQVDTARFLGVTGTALKRWLDKGEIPSVLTPTGRREVPLPELIRLRQEVDQARIEGSERALATVIRERRRRADEIDVDSLLPRRGRTHRHPEMNSLAYHRLVADRLDPLLVDDARLRLGRWSKSGRIDPRWANEWRELLDRPIPEIAKALRSDRPRARELRQSSPFAGVLTEQERRRLAEAVEARGA